MGRSGRREKGQPPAQHESPGEGPAQQGLYDPRYEHDACGTGFVAHVKGRRSHAIVDDALTVLEKLSHRGARGAEPNTGDGAGILTQLPHAFFAAEAARLGFALPPPGDYGVGMLFLPRDAARRAVCEQALADRVAAEGQVLLGWRDVPSDNRELGATAVASEPIMRQVFIGRGPGLPDAADGLAFERKLFVIRRLAEKHIVCDSDGAGVFYIASLSCRTIVYKGMLLAEQLRVYFPDLADPRFDSAIALVHSRFSTNTGPQRRDQHHQGQRQRHEGAPGAIPLGRLRR